MDARDMMTRDVETVQSDEEVSDVLTKLSRRDFTGFPVVDDEGKLVGVVTQRDLVDIFQPSERTLWIPVGFPPFLEPVEYAVDISWNDLDVNLDLLRNASKPIREVMTEDVVTVDPEDSLDTVLELLGDPDLDINRVPVVTDGYVEGIITRQDVLRTLSEERADQ
ncbi:CBS domain-containing protein [Halanaeroarchaeum sulfurireducens]|uniref:Inosine-5'-monophosphate dehydrogenase n=1 Tax=Halanaeroarchaeum sulfurireducens TaxID=1604004 RepID=A0A0F7PDE2_9EURY|nr:CBS domain-containing protein [Halanaeroarchaeum sulfurireducens]AKH98200.1 inosine-5'-monophosphate dehydrogenase [Halanaeroarchaeum sulfurireducens]ALG82594.1 inosine-5'-monophosphate dehydrogenase [Halanaeroarchaeum sulfurireducens]